ncbi:MAG: helix-turn-helix domain-containing protein [Syntrophomonadaceae bacterium]|nr:helix-turn-helix domain-containing protein [Syntrophomonadaceae bacterium]
MEEINVARRIREIRISKGLTLEELGNRTGFTKGLLSKIENSKVSPPVSTLAKIARAMNVSMGEFFSEVEAKPIIIVRAKDRAVYQPEDAPQGQVIETPISGFQQQKMQPIIISIENAAEYQQRLYNHPGQEFIMVLEGTMGYRFDDEELMLSTGDCIYFNAEHQHGPLPMKGKKVKYLSVLS